MEEKKPKINLELLDSLIRGEGDPVTVRCTCKWGNRQEVEFVVDGNVRKKQPFWLGCMDEETMLKSTKLEIVNAPKGRKGQWKHFFNEYREIVVKYFPTEKEEEMQRRIRQGYESTMDICLCSAGFL
ncbi:MAG: hypothetical protein ACOX9E_06245 [Lentisphaeria bacterium]|jgi:hypothetical protein